jgi:glycolate oxidase FAD binding subunit
MTSIVCPSNHTEVQEATEWALSTSTPMAIVGSGSKIALGRSTNLDITLNLSGLTGVKNYEPSELILTARPGTTLKDLTAQLSEHGQELAFEPPDYGAFFGKESDTATLGGAIACNLSGPRRIRAGAARDHFLGMEAINGRGEFFKAGGKVVKNVTGYDLCKLIAGSYGTLALLTEATVKVLPKSEKTRSVLISALTHKTALSVFQKLLSGPTESSGLAHLPANIAKRSKVDFVSNTGLSVTAVRVEGPTPSVIQRTKDLMTALAGYGDVEELHTHRSRMLWKEIGDLSPFVENQTSTVWRIMVPPSQASLVIDNLSNMFNISWYVDWAGGLIWVESDDGDPDDVHTGIRNCVTEVSGQSTLIRGSSTLRASVDVFEPLPKPIFQLNYRIKQAFDPNAIFNPARVYAGI